MPTIIETTVYQFGELSDDAKERAREWMRQCEAESFGDMVSYDDTVECARIIGIEIATDKRPIDRTGPTYAAPKIYWSGFSSQGDGASFVGSYAYAKGAVKAIAAYAPRDNELLLIASGLQQVQARNFYRLTAGMLQGHNSNFYSHSGTMAVDVEGANDMETVDTVTSLMRRFANWIYRQLEAQYEYTLSDESIDENIIANEYTFLESGRRA